MQNPQMMQQMMGALGGSGGGGIPGQPGLGGLPDMSAFMNQFGAAARGEETPNGMDGAYLSCYF